MDAKVISKFSGYNEELGITSVNDVGIYATGENLKKYIPSMEDEDLEKFVVIKSKLLYVGTDEKETEIADRLGIGGGSETSDAGATVKEVQAIVDGVVKVSEENKEKIPKNDSDRLNELECKDDEKGLIGTRLFDRNGLNLTERTWNILIEYNNQNKETARYGSGYYWLKKGETYKIKGKEIEFKNDYVINYRNEEFTVLSGRAVNWNEKATLGVSKNLALNLDPMSFAVGRWEESDNIDEVNKEKFQDFIVKDTDGKEKNTGIQKVGDVKYNDENKSLEFNRSEDNETGEGGYIKLSKDGLDFSNGFTFEIYCNLDRLRYNNIKNSVDDESEELGLFCKMPSLLQTNCTDAMRFGFTRLSTICKFFQLSSWSGEGKNLRTTKYGDVNADNCGYEGNKDFYLTFVYRNYVDETNDSNYDEKIISNNIDKIEYYIDGNLFGYSYYGSDSYDAGRKKWDTDESDFFIGVCPWEYAGNLFYLKGLVYAVRLYEIPVTHDEVKLNYDMTLKYRDSFKDEKF